MSHHRPLALTALLLTTALAWGAQPEAAKALSPLEAAVASSTRSPANVVRDVYRHPLETLTFFGVAEDMTVVELWPGGGWYTEILAPYLKEKGALYAAGFDPQASGDSGKYFREGAMKLADKLGSDQDSYAAVKTSILAPPEKTKIAPAGSADRVLSFRNVHNWMAAEAFGSVLAAAHLALKLGGILGLEEHRAYPDAAIDPKAKNGYVNEAELIRIVEAAGFKLKAKSEINANAEDTRNHPRGVWTLPPTLALGDKDRDKYLAIGESDRMTLAFEKTP